MDSRTLRITGAAILACLTAGSLLAGHRGAPKAEGSSHELTPSVRAAGLTFDATVSPGDRQWVLEAIAKARPEAQRLIGAIDGLVTISTVSEPGAPYVGMAQEGSDDIRLNVAYLDGERKQDRSAAVLHELGHVIDFELVPSGQMQRLAAAVPSSGTCLTAETGDCTAPEERFADTFAKWALRGAVSSVGAGYGVMSPGSLESWGAPLGLLAAQQSVSG